MSVAAVLWSAATPAAEIDTRNARIGWGPRASPHQAFFELVNNSDEPLVLTGARAEHHTRAAFKAPPDNDLLMLDPLEMPQVVPPGDTLRFHPDGGPYLMLFVQHIFMDPGDKTTIELLFEDRDPLPVEFTIER